MGLKNIFRITSPLPHLLTDQMYRTR
uniref:Uncharacterized protein n=1 Tax=Arundo donax TaxID=35708 RepID=A0A0A8Z397_ARUDO